MTDWKETLASIAPTIATALGGPLAGVAVKLAADAMGVESNEEAVTNAVLSGDPEILFRLKQAEKDFKITMKTLGIESKKLDIDNTKSAREMAKVNMMPQVILSAIYTTGYMAVLWQFVTAEVVIPVQSQAAFSIVLGVLTAAQAQILNFWFGSSSGSKEKDDIGKSNG